MAALIDEESQQVVEGVGQSLDCQEFDSHESCSLLHMSQATQKFTVDDNNVSARISGFWSDGSAWASGRTWLYGVVQELRALRWLPGVQGCHCTDRLVASLVKISLRFPKVLSVPLCYSPSQLRYQSPPHPETSALHDCANRKA
jgi:hypothetical protein